MVVPSLVAIDLLFGSRKHAACCFLLSNMVVPSYIMGPCGNKPVLWQVTSCRMPHSCNSIKNMVVPCYAMGPCCIRLIWCKRMQMYSGSRVMTIHHMQSYYCVKWQTIAKIQNVSNSWHLSGCFKITCEINGYPWHQNHCIRTSVHVHIIIVTVLYKGKFMHRSTMGGYLI